MPNNEAAFSLSTDWKQITTFVRSLKGEVKKSVMAHLRIYGRELRDGMRASTPVKTGRAQKAVGFNIYSFPDDIRVKLSGNMARAPHWKTLEHGAMIRPKEATKLAIPIPGSQAAFFGFRARDLRDTPEAFAFDSSFVAKDVIFGVRAGSPPEPLFALKPEVLMRRKELFKTFGQSRQTEFRDRVMAGVAEGLQATIDASKTPGASNSD